MSARLVLTMMLVLVPALTEAQPAAPCPQSGPLSEAQLTELLKGSVAAPRIRQLVASCGVNFEPTGEAISRLHSAGMPQTVLDAVRASTGPAERKRQVEQALWDSIKDSHDPQLFDQFLSEYPDGQYAATAQQKSSALKPSVPLRAAPVINQFSINPTSIQRGQSATLRWNVTGEVTNVSIDQGIGTVRDTGSQRVQPYEPITYALTATGPGGQSRASAMVTVTNPPPTPAAPGGTPASVVAVGPQQSDPSGPNPPNLSAQDLDEIAKRADAAFNRQDDATALPLYRQLAASGHIGAMNRLGWMYNAGRGVARDDAQAVAWFKKAAVNGNSTAMGNVGSMYEHGQGVAQDDTQAVAWYRKAAEKGYAIGMNNLARMYETGRGVVKDTAEAIAWYRKAAALGDEVAKLNLKRLGQ